MNSAFTTATTFLLLAGPALAQTVSATVTTATPMLARIFSSVSAVNQQQSVPANVSGPVLLTASWGGVLASSQWDAFAGTLEGAIVWEQKAEVYESTPSFADAGGELLAHLSAPTATAVLLELSRDLSATPGAIVPICSIDLGDDGLSELTSSTNASIAFTVTIGPQPLAIRLRSFVVQVGQGIVDLELKVRIRPANMQIQPIPVGCSSQAVLFAAPTFVGSGVHLEMLGMDPVVLVFGLSQQPQVIPAALPTPCLLLPSPDLFAVLLPAQSVTLPLPPAVRPVALWVHGVLVSPTTLATLNGFYVNAW